MYRSTNRSNISADAAANSGTWSKMCGAPAYVCSSVVTVAARGSIQSLGQDRVRFVGDRIKRGARCHRWILESCGVERQQAARGIADDRDPLRIDAEHAGVRARPPDGGLHVVDLRGPLGLPGQAVLRRDRDVAAARERQDALVERVRAAADESPAMDVQRRHALLSAGRRLIDVELQIHRSTLAEDDVFLDGDRRLAGLRAGGGDAEGGQGSANPGRDAGGSEETSAGHSIHR